MSEPPAAAHATPAEETAAALEVDPARGLSAAEAAARLERHGPNALLEAPPERWTKRLARQFADVLIALLAAAAVVSAVLGDRLDAIVILAIVVLNGLLGFVQEGRAERTMAALRRLSAPLAKVVRDGAAASVPAASLVPGDRVDLEPGDRVPADLRLLESASLRVQEAALTGESLPVEKDARAEVDADAPLAERPTMAFSGTVVAAGTASGVVVATGMATEIGRIAGLLEHLPAEPTPLQRRLAEVGRTLAIVALVIVALLFGLEALRGRDLAGAFLLAVSLAVAAVPEGLAAVVTVALALGLQRMARRRALVRRLASVETLGAVTVIASDKTGTLTRNEMTVREVLAGGVSWDVGGVGWAPEGELRPRGGPRGPDEGAARADLLATLEAGAWCGHARVARGASGAWEAVGDPTEAALVVVAAKAGLPATDPERLDGEIPFTSDRKAMTVVVRGEDGRRVSHTKGAPEVVLGMCDRALRGGEAVPLDDALREEVLAAARGMAERALRVIGLARGELADGAEPREERLVFLGLAGMIDPPREEAREAVATCGTAGIRVVMITGDHPATAAAVARDLGVLGEGERVVSGADLAKMADDALTAEVERIRVYARVTAADKLRIVSAWRRRGHVVAMTGDGVNDAPAIRAADVGVAMGVTGTDVTKEAADVVLLDDDFATIVAAVEEGRTIYDDVRKFVGYLLATNVGEVGLMLFGALAGWPPPLLAIQILWVNLVTDALPALALGVEPPEPDVMRRPPRPPGERLLTKARALRILGFGLLHAAVAAVSFALVHRGDPARVEEARTAAFATIAFGQLLFAFGCRSPRYTLGQLGSFSNRWLLAAIGVSALAQTAVLAVPFLRGPFGVSGALTAAEWAIAVALAFVPVSAIETGKLVRAARRRRTERAAGPDRSAVDAPTRGSAPRTPS